MNIRHYWSARKEDGSDSGTVMVGFEYTLDFGIDWYSVQQFKFIYSGW